MATVLPSDTPSEATPEGPRYAHLATRAAALVQDAGGAIDEDTLIGHVFGGIGSPTLWRSLLRQILAGDERLVLRADGYWAWLNTDLDPAGDVLSEFVVLDVETTGLKPYTHRVIEVAAIRYRDRREVARLESLCNPGRRLPKFIVELTGIVDALVAEAPPFASLADELVGLLGSSLVVGHNVGFDLAFVNAELKRLGRPGLINERIDTRTLAVAMLPRLRKPSLDAVARDLGLASNPRKLHRAGPDANLTGQVLQALADRARATGIVTLDALKGLGAAGSSRGEGPVGRGRAVLDRSLLADIPRAPGVYIMRDRFDQVIYVGKAKNLRDRVGSYYSQPLGYTRKMDGLLESLVRIDVEVVGSELEALLLESQLIRRYQPRYNTALRSHEQYPYIRVDVTNPWPRVTLAKARKDDGARYFGPYRNAAAARKTVDLINRVVPLRTCTRSFKNARSYGSPCLELDLGRCLGPCAGRADRERYTALVHDVVAFLDGRESALYELLWRGLEEAAATLDFERAGNLRRALLSVEGIVNAQRRLRESIEGHTLLLVLPGAEAGSRELLLVVQGRLWAQLRARGDTEARQLADRIGASWRRFLDSGLRPVDQDSVDDASILNRWLTQFSGHPAIIPLPTPPATPDWPVVVTAALALPADALIFDSRSSANLAAELIERSDEDDNSAVTNETGCGQRPERIERPEGAPLYSSWEGWGLHLSGETGD